MNRIKQLLADKNSDVLSIYYTAGYPALEDTRPILSSLQASGADLVEIGMPYSDPVADGPTIQESNQKALENGISINKLFSQLSGMRKEITLPVILMGYINPIMQFGVEAFCKNCQKVGIDGLIVPDLPISEYQSHYQELFHRYGLENIFLITPQTTEERIKKIDKISNAFIYVVSSAGITGAKGEVSTEQVAYFERLNAMGLKNPRLIGFGISNRETFNTACKYANGAIIGSAFIDLLSKGNGLETDINDFIKSLKQ